MIDVRAMRADDLDAVLEIYAQAIEARIATFETKVPDRHQWSQKHHQHSRFTAIDGTSVVGWAALQPVSTRRVYQGVAEVSVYVAIEQSGQGIGTHLLKTLVKSAEENGIWTLQSSLFPENKATINLHTACGFRTVGVREKIAQLDGIWRDTWIMERRSERINT